MKNLFSAITLMTFWLACFATEAMAADLPPNWPWRGVVVNSFETSKKDVGFLQDHLGINHLSLHVKTRLRAKRFKVNPEQAWNEELQWVDTMLDACQRRGITTTVVSSYFPIDPKYGLNQSSPQFWNSEKHISDLLKRVDQLAKHLKNRGNELSAIEILAEPSLRSGKRVKTPSNWPEVREQIIKTIRKHDPNRWVVIAPGPGGTFQGYNKLELLNFSRIIYAAHVYAPHAFTHQGLKQRPLGVTYPGRFRHRLVDKNYLRSAFEPLHRFQKRHNVPVWIGEFSAARWAVGAEQYIKDAVDIFDEYGWSWSYFQYKGAHMWNPDYSTAYSTNKRSDWTKDYVGLKSVRWKTLREIFGKESAKVTARKPSE